MRSKIGSRGRKTRRGNKLNTTTRRSRSMKLGGVQISARLQQQPAQPARSVRRGRSAAKPAVEKHPVAAGIPAAVERPAILETLPIVQPAALHTAEQPARRSNRLSVWAMAICIIAISGVLLFMGRPAPAPGNGGSLQPPKAPVAIPESHQEMDNPRIVKPAQKPLRAEAVPAAPVSPAAVNLPVQPVPLVARLETPPVAESSPKPLEQAALVTITGCLDSDRDTFTLKDTSGVDVPSSRTWRTGFLKKRRASIEVVDAVSGLRLQDHVGHRVSLTGSLVDHDMQVRSLRRVAASCRG